MAEEFDSGAFLDRLLAAVRETSDRGSFDCPVCTSSEWTILDGTITQQVSGGVGEVKVVPVVCNNCGYIAQFAAGQDFS